MPVRFTLLSGGHCDKRAKVVDRRGKSHPMPAGGISAGETVEYPDDVEDPKLDERFPHRFTRVGKDSGKNRGVNIDSLTVDQLKAYAEENEIDLGGANRREEIVRAIKAQS